MTETRLPKPVSETDLIFDTKVQSPLVRRGLELLSALEPPVSFPQLLWEFRGPATNAAQFLSLSTGQNLHFIAGEDVLTLDAGSGIEQSRASIPGANSLSVTSEVLYVGTHSGSIHALGAINKGERWQSELAFSLGEIVATDDAVYGGGESWLSDSQFWYEAEGLLCSLDAKTGMSRWQVGTGMTVCSLAVAESQVFVGTFSDAVYAIDGSTGAILWTFKTHSYNFSPLIVSWDSVYVGDSSGRVFALDAATGKQRWRFWKAWNEVLLTMAGDLVIVGTRSTTNDHLLDQAEALAYGTDYRASLGRIYALDATTGEVTWNWGMDGYVILLKGDRDTAYVSNENGRVYALDHRSGSERWHFDVKSPVSSLITHDGVVYVGTTEGKVLALRME